MMMMSPVANRRHVAGFKINNWIIMNIKHILTGWGRKLKFIATTPVIKQLSKYRLGICEKCPEAKPSKILKIINGKGEYVNSLQCTKCECPCLEKSLVTKEKCPLKKW